MGLSKLGCHGLGVCLFADVLDNVALLTWQINDIMWYLACDMVLMWSLTQAADML